MDTTNNLLERVRGPQNSGAWRQFDDRYRSIIEGWIRRKGLPQADVDDVTQEVMLAISKSLQNYKADKGTKFRSWLFGVVLNSLKAFFRQRASRRDTGTGDSDVLELLSNSKNREDLAERLSEEFDLESLEMARERVRARVEPATWQAFVLRTDQNLSGEEIGRVLGMSRPAVYQAASQVKTLIRQELATLTQPE